MTPTGYRYRAAKRNGRLQVGWIAAGSEAAAMAQLLAAGLTPVAMELGERPRVRERPAARHELAIVFRSIATLSLAGLPLARTLDATAPIAGGRLRQLLREARGALAEGQPLSNSLERSDGIVPASVLALVRAGERTGRLGEALGEAATQLEREAELAARIRSALAYPGILAVGGLITLVVIGGVVIPRFAELLADLGQQVPPAAAAVLGASRLLVRWGPVAAFALALGAIAWAAWIATEQGRRQWDAAMLSLPGIGALRLAIASVHFLRALASALGAGLPLVGALRIAAGATADREVEARIERACDDVLVGQPLVPSLTRAGAVTAVGLQLLAVGESAGRLAELAARGAEVLGADAERRVASLVRMLEPALIIFLGALVAFVAGALLQAVYSLRPGAA